ncbi:hypothetical protein D3C81_2122630 [compost metagenome]
MYIRNDVFTAFIVRPDRAECLGVMPSRSADVIQVPVVEIRADIRLDVRASRCDQLAATVDDGDHVRFRSPEALHVRIDRD